MQIKKVNDELKSHGVKLHSLTENMVLSPDADEKTIYLEEYLIYLNKEEA